MPLPGLGNWSVAGFGKPSRSTAAESPCLELRSMLSDCSSYWARHSRAFVCFVVVAAAAAAAVVVAVGAVAAIWLAVMEAQDPWAPDGVLRALACLSFEERD